MKKTITFLSLIFIIPALFVFTGCKNEDKTLAKNLDNTITNLIYSVSSLDFADSNILSDLNGFSQNSVSNFNTNCPTDITNDKNSNQNINNSSNQIDLYNYNQTDDYYNEPRKPRRSFGKTPISRLDQQSSKYNNQTNGTERIKYEIYKSKNNNGSNQLSTFSNQTNNEIRLVKFSTDEISKNDSLIREKITALINERSNLLLCINDLYKGNVSLSIASKNAINAYMNIIKDNTSYLNQNKGIVTNQLSEANKLYEENNNSSLINAYIIRTNEAVASRIVKIESSISAMQAITQIIQGSLKSTSPNYNMNMINNKNTDNNISILEQNENNNINQESDNNLDKNSENNYCDNSDNNCCKKQEILNNEKTQNLDMTNNKSEPNNNPTLRSINTDPTLQNQNTNFDKMIIDSTNKIQTENLQECEKNEIDPHFQIDKNANTDTIKNNTNKAKGTEQNCKYEENCCLKKQQIGQTKNNKLEDQNNREIEKNQTKFNNEINQKIRENQKEIYDKQNQEINKINNDNDKTEINNNTEKILNCFIENKKKSFDKNLKTAK